MGFELLWISIFPFFMQKRGPTQSILMRIQPCRNLQGFHLWIVRFGCKRRVGAKNVGMGSRSYFITGQNSNWCKWISGRLVHLLMLWIHWADPMRVISLGIWGVNDFARGWRSWGIRTWTFCVISHNCKGIWKLIRITICGLNIQPSVFKIDFFGCGNFWRLFDKILPIWWERACFHVWQGR